jgi:hypothetical protein
LDDVERELAAPGTERVGIKDSIDGLLGREGVHKILERELFHDFSVLARFKRRATTTLRLPTAVWPVPPADY